MTIISARHCPWLRPGGAALRSGRGAWNLDDRLRQDQWALVGSTVGVLSAAIRWLRARPLSAVEAGTGEAGTGDRGPVRSAARRVGGVEPLLEELAQPLLTGAAVHGQPPVEDGLELRLGNAGPAICALELPQRRIESGRPE